MTYLNPTQLSAVRRWLPLYLEAERKIGVPWAMLAALHYRETNFGASTARVGGILQFDPPLPPAKVREYGQRYGILDLTDPESDPRTAILCAAAFVQGKVAALGRPALTPQSTPEEVADAAWSYNGRAYGSWQNSPYVNNDPQAGRQMWIRGTVPDLRNPAKRVRIDQPDRRPGVLAVMREVRARVAVPVSVPVKADVTPEAAPVGNPIDVVMVVGPDGKFRPPGRARFTVPWPALIGYSGGKWWVRPATKEELEGGAK